MAHDPLTPAKLGPLSGVGLITVLRDDEGRIVEANGSFRPADERLSPDALDEAFKVGAVVPFEGQLVDQHGKAAAEAVTVEVVITGIDRYTYLDGSKRMLVNFVGKDGA
jgi:hypothetical protein